MIRNIKTYKKTLFVAFICFILSACLFSFAPKAHAAFQIEPIYSVLKNTDSGTGQQIKEIWSKIITYVNYFIIAVLIFVAFAQILRINVNTYGIKKILPALLLAIIAANFSFLFCRLLVDLANVTLSLFIENPVDHSALSANFSGSWANPTNALEDGSVGDIVWFMISQLFVIVGAVLVLILAYLFIIRIWMVYFLVVLAPLAFMSTVLPATKSLFNQWWSNFAKWVFMPVVSVFWIWLGNQWVGSIKNDSMMSYVFAGVCYYLAITTPFKMGGAIMSGWANFGKKAYNNWATRKAKEKWVDPAIQEVKDNAMSWYRSQGSGHKYNPIGMIARRGKRVEDRRKDATERAAAWDNTLYREAMGGKEGQYLSKAKQEAIGKRKADISSLLGEKEWMEQHLEELHLGTEAGKEDLDSRVQFYFRTQGTDKAVERLNSQAKADVLAEEPGEGQGDFFKNQNYVHWYKKWVEENAKNRPAVASAKKLEADILSDTYLDAAKLNLTLLGYKASKNTLIDVEKILKDPTSLPEEERNKLEKKYRIGNIAQLSGAERKSLTTIYQETKKKNDLAESDFSLQSAALLKKYAKTDSQGNVVGFKGMSDILEKMWKDQNGNFTTSINKVREMADVNGISEAAKGMWNDRLAKELANDHNEELRATQSKRSSLGAEIYLQTEMPADYELHLQGRDGAIIGSRSKKVYAEVNHSTKAAPQNPETATIYQLKGEQEARIASTDWERGKASRDVLSSSVAEALEKFMKSSQTLNKATTNAMEKMANEIAKSQNVSAEKLKGFVETYKKKTDFTEEEKTKMKQYQEETLKDIASDFYNIKGTKKEAGYNQNIHVYHDETGNLKVSLLDSVNKDSAQGALKQQAEIASILNTSIINHTSRSGPGADARNGLMARRILATPVVNTEAHVAFYEKPYLPPKIVSEKEIEEYGDEPIEFKEFGENA
ncbi:MAG: hypothetical protein WC536_01895 [Patescibacteria group bacterium]